MLPLHKEAKCHYFFYASDQRMRLFYHIEILARYSRAYTFWGKTHIKKILNLMQYYSIVNLIVSISDERKFKLLFIFKCHS